VQPGKLVYFYTSYTPWMKDYINRNPGIVLEEHEREIVGFGKKNRSVVMWSDGSVTHEHDSYLNESQGEVSQCD
jgi:hypothetical protein